jgi:hypothetical protein
MGELRIYIDHYGGHEDCEFARLLKERVKGIKGDINVEIYSDFDIRDEFGDDWEDATVSAIQAATIVIPIISESYISFATERVEKAFSTIIDSKSRFLFPILFKQANWGGFTWIVRSKLIPDDETPLFERQSKDIDLAINNLINNIKNITVKLHEGEGGKNTSLPQALGKSVFISHDHDDADFAELLKLKLEKHGLEGWIDSERLKIGQDWREEIDSGIQESLAVIAIMTPEARKSEYVTYEWAFAWGKGKKVFPLMLKQTQIHPRLESLQYLDFTNRTARPWDQLIGSIIELSNA